MLKEGLLITAIGLVATNVFLYMIVLLMRLIQKPLARFNHILPEQTRRGAQ